MAVKIRERPLGSGKWWLFIDYKGKRCARYIKKGKVAAEKAALELEARLDVLSSANKQGFSISLPGIMEPGSQNQESRLSNSSTPLFTDYSIQWLEDCEARGLKHTTIQSYQGLLHNHLLPVFGSMRLSEINRTAVKDLALKKRKTGSSVDTVRLILACLSSIFSSAIEESLVVVNPALKPGKFMKMRGKHEAIDPFTPEEETIFLDTARTYVPRYYPLFLFLLRTGSRIGEAMALQPGDIDFRGQFIQIRRNWTRRKLTTPKNNKRRRVDMSPQLEEVLKNHLTSQELEARMGDQPPSEWVFPNEEGRLLELSNIRRRVFKKVLERAGLRRIRIHDLRHTYASRLIANGESLAYVRDQMGHSSIQVTVDIYGHLVPGSNRQAVERLDRTVENLELAGKSATIRNRQSETSLRLKENYNNSLKNMEPASGIEPPTC